MTSSARNPKLLLARDNAAAAAARENAQHSRCASTRGMRESLVFLLLGQVCGREVAVRVPDQQSPKIQHLCKRCAELCFHWPFLRPSDALARRKKLCLRKSFAATFAPWRRSRPKVDFLSRSYRMVMPPRLTRMNIRFTRRKKSQKARRSSMRRSQLPVLKHD